MKKIFTLTMLSLLCTLTASAQSFNLFPAEDVDADGWLWFNTQEKIDKYVGLFNKDDYTVDPNGKVVQLVFANITPDYTLTIADPEVYGVDKAGNYSEDEGCNQDELIKGAIVLAPASGTMGTLNGGCLILNLPSCSTISLYLSSESSTYMRTLKILPTNGIDNDDSPAGGDPWTGSTKAIYSKASMFSTLSGAGHYKWETAATENNGYNTGVTFQSDEPVYFCLQNCRNRKVYIHGIKVTTPKQETIDSGDDDKPAITATGTVGVERTISVGLNGAGKVSLDWGDGILVEQTTTQAYDGWDGKTDFTGTPTGSGKIKIYGDGITYLSANGKFNEDKTDIPNALTAIDVTNAPDLTELEINANKISSINITKNAKLAKLNFANNQVASIKLDQNTELTNLTANDNLLTAIDLSKNTKLTAVVFSNNKLTELDFTNNPLVKTFTCLDNELTSVTIGDNTASGHTFQFGGNKLTTFSLKQATNLATSFVYLRNNQLTELELPAAVRRIWVDGNKFTLAQLNEFKALATQTYTYATTFTGEFAQAPYEIPENINVNATVDLSSQATLGTTATNFVWKTADGTALTEGTDYTVSNGVFTFLTEQESIHCEMTNAELPAFTAEKPYLTTNMKVEGTDGIDSIESDGVNGAKVWYNLAGQRVAQPSTKGVYIRNGKKIIYQ